MKRYAQSWLSRRGIRIGAAATVALLTSGVVHTNAAATTAGPARSTTVVRTAAKAATNPLPNMTVTDLRTGKAVPLRNALSGKKPLLVWFWAPY